MGGAQGDAAALMVGRDRELAWVTRLLDDALAGRGRLLLCAGEAGIGKTRLAEEAAASAASRGMPVAWARAADPGSSPPYGLWRLVLADPAVSSDARSGDDLWSAVFGHAERPDPGAETGGAYRFAMFAEVRRRLMGAAERTGLLLVLDDLQWADEASAVLLADVGRQLSGTRILAFATYRSSGAGGDGLLPRLSAEAHIERMDLHGLPAESVGDLLAAAGLDASPEQARQVHAETGGNPFLVRELAQVLTGPNGSSVPERVIEVTAYRLGRLSDAAQDTLQAAAVAGNSFSAGVVAKMLDRPVLTLLGPLEEGRAAGFLVPGGRRGDYRFSHALVSAAIVGRLSSAEHQRLHAAAADAIVSLYEGDVRPHLAQIARHRVEASWPGGRAPAVTACEAAADAAVEALAFEEAVRLYRQALSVGEDEISEADRDRLELGLAAALYRSGDLAGWKETTMRVGRRAERRRDRLALARTALVMDASGEIGWDAEICRTCEQALAGDDLPTELRARVSSRYAQALVYGGRYERAGEVSRDALAIAESSADPLALVDALRARQLACCAPEGNAERTVLAHRMIQVADITGSTSVEMWARLWRIDTLFETGDLRSIQHELSDLSTCLERVRGPIGQWHLLLCSATLAQGTGRFTEAIRLAADAFKLMSDMAHEVAFGGYAVILSQVSLHIGFGASGLREAFSQIPDHLKPGVVDTTRGLATVFPALTLALIHLDQGDHAAAAAAYALAGPPRSWTPSQAMRMSAWGHALPVAIGLGRTDDIEFLAERFEAFRGRHVANGAGSGVYMGPVELFLGMAAATLGRLDAAAADLQTAVSACDANGACGYAVQARVELAAALIRRQAPGDLSQARAALHVAAAEAGRLGMVPFAQRIGRLSARLPAEAPSGPQLSPRELEVARLVARGLTNKQIGQELYVSERTAENHIQHILTKLGFANRSQIAAWYRE